MLVLRGGAEDFFWKAIALKIPPMCNLYTSVQRDRLSMKFQVAAPVQPYLPTIAPLKEGPSSRPTAAPWSASGA